MNDKDPSYWVEVPPTASPPTGSAEHARLHSSSDAILLVLLTLLLLDTFLPWQRACLNVSGFGVHISGCLSANAWTASGARFGQIAGVLAILAIIVQGLRLGGVGLGDSGDVLVRALIYGTVAAGAIKWLLVIGKLAAFASWIGLLLLLAIAILESTSLFGYR